MRQVLFLLAVSILVTILVAAAGYYILRARRSSRNAWMMLMGRLKPIDRDMFAAVALDLLEEREERQQLRPEVIFDMIGGMNGMTALEENCDVLTDLATYVPKWYPDALQLGEELRLNSREIK